MRRERVSRERVLIIEDPDCEATVDFLDVQGQDGFLVTVRRNPDLSIFIRVRQSGPRGSSMFRDTDFTIDRFDTGEEPEQEDDTTACEGCGELTPSADLVDDFCESCRDDYHNDDEEEG